MNVIQTWPWVHFSKPSPAQLIIPSTQPNPSMKNIPLQTITITAVSQHK